MVFLSKCGYRGSFSKETFWQYLFWHLTPPGSCNEHFLYLDTELLCGPENEHTWITFHEKFMSNIFLTSDSTSFGILFKILNFIW
jgi:hypothetical protein